MNKSEAGLIYTITFTFIVCFVFVFLLSLTNIATASIVERNEQLKQQSAILRAMGLDPKSEVQVLAQFMDIEQQQIEDFILYKGTVNGDEVYVKEFQGPGLWGTIYGAIGIIPIQNTISGLEISNHNETPGLGARIDETWFKSQLVGESIVNGAIRMPSRRGVGDSNKENGEIDGVSGATRTSESMTKIINQEIMTLFDAIGG